MTKIRFLAKRKGDTIIPVCILCEKEIENERPYVGVWVEPDFEYEYRYYICENCFEQVLLKNKEGTQKIIEEKLMLISTRQPHIKLKVKNEDT